MCFWIGGILCSGINFSPIYLWSSYLLCVFLFIFPSVRRLSSLFLFPCLFFSSAYISSPPDITLPVHPVNFSCRYEDKLTGNAHLVTANRHYFCLESPYSFLPGDSIQFTARFYGLQALNRSGAFDYSRFLQQKGISARIQVIDSIRLTGHAKTAYYYLAKIRKTFIQKTDLIFRDTLSSAIIKALCLGYKEELSPSTRELFAETGTMHLLAVSGLHTGAVWLLLSYIFKMAGLAGKKAQLFLLPVLWIYACITGLSPSVVRAAHILTFLTVSQAFHKDYSALNSVAASAFVVLLLNPFALYSVSMQMSYAAYTGIICIYPLLKKLVFSFSKLSLPLCVTLSAQIATLPLSAYYFHAISLNSFLINLIAIPLTTFLLYGGILSIILPACISSFCATPIQFLCKLLTCLLNLFNKINLQANHLYPTSLHIFLIYGLIFFMILYLYYRKKQYLKLTIWVCIISVSYSCLHNYLLQKKKEIVIFHLYQNSCILLKQECSGFLLKNTLPAASFNTPLSYTQRNKLQLVPLSPGFIHPHFHYFQKQFQNRYTSLYIADNLTIPPPSDTWIITNNIYPQAILFPAAEYPNLVILDGSNHRKCTEQWKNVCQQLQIPVRTTWEEGNIHLRFRSQKR